MTQSHPSHRAARTRYAVAVALVGVAAAMTYAGQRFVEQSSPFCFFYPAVLFAAFVGGTRE